MPGRGCCGCGSPSRMFSSVFGGPRTGKTQYLAGRIIDARAPSSSPPPAPNFTTAPAACGLRADRGPLGFSLRVAPAVTSDVRQRAQLRRIPAEYSPNMTHARGNRALVIGHRLVTHAAERAGIDPHHLTSSGASAQLRRAVAALASTGEHGSPLSLNRLFAVGRGGLLIKRVRRGCSGRWGGVVARLPWVHGVGQVRHPRRRLRTDRLQRDPGRVHAVEQAGAGAEEHR